MKIAAQLECAHRKCDRTPTQAFDVFSWFFEQERQVPLHYEVCDKHAAYFGHSFAREKSERVRKDLVEWRSACPVDSLAPHRREVAA